MHVRRGISAAAAIVVVGLLVKAVPAVAHHSNALFYDPARTVEAQGPVTKFIFKNPHAFLYFRWQIKRRTRRTAPPQTQASVRSSPR